jgi:Domain of Unknown Function (DUF1080)
MNPLFRSPTFPFPYLAMTVFAVLACPRSAAIAANAPADPSAAITPDKPIALFNGKDLSNFYTWLVDHKYSDPNRVFSVVDRVDGAPAIRVSGENWGGFVTKESYTNYHLVVEYRWGDLTWGERKDKALDSGILVHARGPDGNSQADFNGPWMNSVEYQLIEGATGDFIRVRGFAKDGSPLPAPNLTGTVRVLRNGQMNWDPNGAEVRFDENARGRLCCSYKDPDWSGGLGYRGARDVERPVGQWNKAEIICKADMVTFILNGETINRGTRCTFTSGKLLFQSEGAEVFFRRIQLYPAR